MKNSKPLRVLLIALVVAMAFSLFACAETPEESQSSTEESTLNTNETDPKDSANSSEVTSEETTEETSEETSEDTTEETSEDTTEETSEETSEETTEETSEETSEDTTEETSEDTTEETSEDTTEETSKDTTEETSEETTEETSEETTEETDETPACNHVEEVVAGTAATCENTGLTDGKKCSACGETLVAQQVIPALGHAWDNGEVTTAPDCDNKGVKTYTCANDAAHTRTEEVPSLGHVEEVVAGTAATCENTGLTDGKKCSACGETLVAQQAIPALEHKWVEDKVITSAECEKDGEMSYVCANDATHKKTEPISAFGHGTEGKTWKYISNNDTEYKDTRYAVEGAACNSCGKILETRAAVIAFNLDSITAADSTGANATLAGIGSGYGAMVYDPEARVTANEAIYLRNNQFIVASGWVGINGDFNTSNAYYRILDENGEPLTDWVEKIIYDSGSNTAPVEKSEDTGAYKSVKGQLAAHGVTNFVARGFKTNNLNTTINDVDYAKYDKPISIEYALKAVDAPEGSDLITVIVFKNVYKVCTSHSCSDWKYVSGEGTEFEGTGYAVQGGTCDNCGEKVTRAAVIAFNFDSVASADSAGTANSMAAFGTGSGAMVTDPDARVTTQDKIYLRNNQFLMGSGWLGVAGEIDIETAYYRILNNETGAVILDWQAKVISDSSSSSARPQEKPTSAGSYTSVKTQLNAKGITDFTAYGFRTNNLVTNIDGTEYASTTTPIAIEYAVKIVGAPEGYDLVRVIVFKNIYKAS